MRVLLVGATGTTGRRAAAELARAQDVERLVVAGRSAARAEQLARVLGGPNGKVAPAAIDVTHRNPFSAVRGDVDVVVSCAGPSATVELPAVRAAVEAGLSYTSLCDDPAAVREVLELDHDVRDAGVAVVGGCGLSPGITNWLAELGAAELDEVTEIDIAVAASAADASGEAWLLHLARALSREARSALAGTSGETAAATPKLVYFPEPLGWVETFEGAHPEAVTLPLRHGDLRSLRYRIGLTEKALMDAVRASLAAGLGSGDRWGPWLRLARFARPVLRQFPPRGPVWSGARVDVRGVQGGRVTTISLGVVDRLANLAAIPLTMVARLMASRDIDAGVHPPEEAVASRDALINLGRRGVRVARLEPEPM